ncbi:VWA domain-containing protein [Rhodocyclus tenuis]|uniref:nitric oxide reductase activation protein NorD n=1 Tax=Rhodocyclus gracilis TaxID=2929842 RepID=UPI001298DB73|nr:nitric oxide reductase activation protein NorD [Rhodocyclus gracilis]MRD73748.1 VWA domain-containing protein [Rhodocyclus gracilis]
MSAHLAEHQALLDELPAAAQALAAAAWPEAVRALSARGVDNWLKGALALQRMGRGDGIVAAWIGEVPAVARELGEDILPDFAQHCLQFASRTSGAVIERIVASAPTAARRLGDAELFRDYLRLLDVLLGQAPRGLRPLLEHLDELLAVLTLGGLRRWALWGAQAHRTDFAEQLRYFSLASEEAKAVLQQERKGTLFVDIHRRIGMYLRALWGRDFFLRPSAGDFASPEGSRPFIADFFVHLPDACDDWQGLPGLELYRAAAAHCAAHIVATSARLDGEASSQPAQLSTLQRACVGLIEDARVEALAIRRFPRLKELWLQFHRPDAQPEAPTNAPADSVGARFGRIARALLDADAADDAGAADGAGNHDALVAWTRERFAAADLSTHVVSRELGLALAGEITRLGLPWSAQRDGLAVPYRDDNRYLWEYDRARADDAFAAVQREAQVRRYVSVSEMVNEVEVETAGDDAQEIWVCASEFFADDGVSFNAREGREPVAEPCHYDEFDYQLQLTRPLWTTVQEKRPKLGELAVVEQIIEAHRPLTQRLKHLLEALQPQGVQRIRKLEDGDELDLEAAIRAQVDRRLAQTPDPRVMMRSLRKTRDIAVLVLLDLSESTKDRVAGQDYSVLELTRAATVLLGEAIDTVGDAFALHGFCSDGRHNVFYQRYKDFAQPWSDLAKARLAGMEGRLSTRMGAAIRHAGAQLARVRATRKLLLVVTDGEPADIDVRDPHYLRFDAKKAIEEVSARGVKPFCLTLDPRADQYVARVFGQRNYLVLDHVERLPERLPLLYAGLAR